MNNKKRIISAAVLFALCIPLTMAISGAQEAPDAAPVNTPAASDAPAAGFASISKQAQTLMDEGILSGYPDGLFHPENNVTRAEFAKMLMLTIEKSKKELYQQDSTSDIKFSDVPDSHWAYQYITDAARTGLVNGTDKNTFSPDANITYEQAAKMITSAFDGVIGAQYPFEYISLAVDSGYLCDVEAISGEYITRADAASILYNAYQKTIDEAEISEYEQEYRSSFRFNFASGGGAASKSMAFNAAPAAVNAVPEMAMTDDIAYDSAVSLQASGAALMRDPGDALYALPHQPFNTEEYTSEDENIFKNAALSPLSTFSIDTDTASYSNMRRFILQGRYPEKGSVRAEEIINYFDYDYTLPTGDEPFSITTELSSCPWNENNKLALVAVKGDEIPESERKPSNIVFLIDTSGSMYSSNKLPLVQRSLSMLLEKLGPQDKISIVTYASGTGVALDSESAENTKAIRKVLFSLTAGGSTAGSSGINLAYDIAEKNKIDGNNRIILCTDGDFNVGPSSTAELESLIEEKREKGIFLSVLGFGMGNYKDNRMETLADKGNGNYAYIDNIKEAKKVLVDDMTKTIYTIAKDVKIQVEFNPEKVKEYRLVGYENRKLNNEDFDNDAKDAGELGAGSVVTALYEIVPADGSGSSSELKYQTSQTKGSDEYMNIKLRYKDPDGTQSRLTELALSEETSSSSDNFRFAAAAAEFAMILNDSEFKGSSDIDSVIELAKGSKGEDKFGLRAEFIQLADLYRYLDKPRYEYTETPYNEAIPYDEYVVPFTYIYENK